MLFKAIGLREIIKEWAMIEKRRSENVFWGTFKWIHLGEEEDPEKETKKEAFIR